MMKTKFFTNSLILEVYLIGYTNKGESIVFFFKTDNTICYSGVVDCYEYKSVNKTIELLKKENLETIDFLCWTHPHDDHSIGIETLLEQYCDDHTKIWLTDIYPDKIEECGYSKSSIKMYTNIKSRVRTQKSRIKFAKDDTTLDRFRCVGCETYLIEIKSFAPNSTIIAERKELNQDEEGNPYSIGLSIFAGKFNIMLCGDVENKTIERFDESFFDTPIDYIKIPHHGSSTGNLLPKILKRFGIDAPSVATSTVYSQHNLPEEAVLMDYKKWHTKEIYITSHLSSDSNKETYGIVFTSFDILENREYPIETSLQGNSTRYC